MKTRIERNNVLRKLAWETFVVGGNAGTSEERMAILRTMARLLESEVNRSVAVGNSGKTARELLPRLIGSTQSVRTTYLDEAARLADELLADLEHGTPPTEELCEAVVGVLVSVRVEDSWADGVEFHFSQGVILPESERGKAIVGYCERLWRIASISSDEPRRIALSLLSKHHQTLNFADRKATSTGPDWSFLVRSHLERARSLATNADLSLSEWFVLRSLWDWHAKFDDQADLKNIAQECEALFRSGPRAGFAALLLDNDDKYTAIGIAAAALRSQDESAIAEFFRDGCAFVVTKEHAWRRRRLETVAWELGSTPVFSDSVLRYMERGLRCGPPSIDLSFAIEILGGRLEQLRQIPNDDAIAREVRAALTTAPNDEARRKILIGLYQETRVSAMRTIECELLVEYLGLFESDTRLQFLGCIFAINSTIGRQHADALLREVFAETPFYFVDALRFFCAGFHLFVYGRSEPLVPQDDYEWLLDMFAHIPNPPHFRAFGEFDEVIKPYPKFALSWFVDMLALRRERLQPLADRDREVYDVDESVWILTRNLPLLDIVAPLAAGSPVQPSDREAIESLLALSDEPQSISHYLPSTIARLDPDGVLTPDLVCARLEALRNPKWQDIAMWADYASAYRFNSTSWRRIALVACSLATHLSEEDSWAVFSHLSSHQTKGWKGQVGVVHERWTDAVTTAMQELADETEASLRAFREWRIKCAERDLEYQKGRNAEARRLMLGDVGGD